MVDVLGAKKNSLKNILFTGLILIGFSAWSQTPVTQYPCDPRSTANGGNCPASCVYPANVERGCNCFDNIDNDGDGVRDSADPDCASYFGLEFVGEGSDCSITPPGASTPFDLVGPPVVSGQNTSDTQSKVAAGDVDGNGTPDAVITSKWNSEVRVVATAATTGLAKFGGGSFSPGDIIADMNLSGGIAARFGNCDGVNRSRLLFEHEVLIADINKDGDAEIFAVVSNRGGNPKTPPQTFYLVAMEITAYGPGGLQLLYDPVCLGRNRPGTFGIADMDGDGKAEIYLRDRIFAAETGKLLASPGSKLMTGGGTADWDVNVSSASVAVDIKSAGNDGGKMELVVGGQIYTIPSLTNRNPGGPAALTLFRSINSVVFDINGDGLPDQYFVKLMNDPAEYGVDTHSSTSVADIDKDGYVDVVVTGAINSATGRTAVLYWNVRKNFVHGILTPNSALLGIPATQTPDYNNYLNGWIWGTGRVNIGDANMDGKLDLSFIAGAHLFVVSIQDTTTAAAQRLYSVWNQNAKNVPSSGGVIPLGYRIINDTRSGVLTVTMYDFTNDGTMEIVYRDSEELAIIDGATGMNKLFSRTCRSHTYTEGPIIADVNGDGNTDICVACNRSDNPAQFNLNADIQQQALGEIRMYYSSGEWLPTRKVWNQPGYFVVNINDDLTLPFPQFDIAIKFTGNCSVGPPGARTPFNVFMNQVPFLSAGGCPIYPAPDLTFIGDDPNDPNVDPNDPNYFPKVFVESPICGNLDIKVGFNITNSGDIPINTSIPVSFYQGSPYASAPNTGTLLHSTTIVVNNLSVGDTLSIGDLKDANGNIIRLGDLPFIEFDGPGSTFQMYVVLYNDGSTLPIDTTQAASGQECDIRNNFWPIQVVPRPFTVNIDSVDNVRCLPTSPPNGQLISHISVGPDTVIDLSPYAFQWYQSDMVTPIPGATNYNISGLAGGDYYLVITNTQKGCSSDPILGQVVDGPLIIPGLTVTKVSDQTTCDPPNGSLRADVTGGNAGFEFSWEDIGGPIGVTGPLLQNVRSGTYTVVVTETASGCTTEADGTILDFTQEPDVTATAVDVVNCLNPSSGRVSATAFIGGVAQDSTEYRFDWYFYDIATNTQGSIHPSSNGNPTVVGVATGYYEVVVTQLATGCREANTAPDTIEVRDATFLPEIRFTELAPQTSCDPTQPNGRLQADAFSGGSVLNPADFTFAWFEGQNTTNPHTGGSSGTNGQIAEMVKGGGQAYTVRITTANQCSVFRDTVINEIIVYPQVTLSTTPNSVCDQSLGFTGSVSSSVTFSGNSITAPHPDYTFRWYNGSVANPANERVADLNKQNLTAVDSGFYTLVVTNTVLNCPSVANVEQVLSIKALPIITASADPSTNCLPAVTGNGGVQVTDVDGVGVTADYAFTWHRGSDITGPVIANVAASPDTLQGASGNFFSVLVRNNLSGCENTSTVEVTDSSVLPLVTLNALPNSICDASLTNPPVQFNGEVRSTITNQGANPIGDYRFTWTDEETSTQVLQATGTAGQNLLNRDSSYYTVVVQQVSTGCISNPVTAQVTPDITLPTITANAIASTNCDPALANGRVQVTDVDGAGTGAPFVFEWRRGNTFSGYLVASAAASPDTLQGTTGRFYTVQVTNQDDGCRSTATVEVPDAFVLPLVTLNALPNSICDATLTNPPVQFNGEVRSTITNQGANLISDYRFTWTDDETSTQVLQATGAAGQNLLNRDSSYYTVVVVQLSTGCVSNPVTAQVTPNITLPTITADAVASTNCDPALANGRVQVTDVDGAGTGAPFVFEWRRGNTFSGYQVASAAVSPDTLQGATGRFYTVQVTNQDDGCRNTATVEVPDASVLPLPTLTPFPNSICDASLTNPPVQFNGEVHSIITNQGAFPINDYEFTWTDNETSAQVFQAIGAGGQNLLNRDTSYYTLVVRHISTGCLSNPVIAQVTPNIILPAITADANASTNCIPSLANGGVQVTDVDGLGTGAPFAFEWRRGTTMAGSLVASTAASPDTLQGGTGRFYIVQVTNQNDGCRNTRIVEVPDARELPVITLAATDNTICVGTPNGTAFLNSVTYMLATINDPGPFTGYSFSWSSGENTSTINNKAAGFYDLVVTKDDVGCSSNPVTVQVRDNKVNPVILLTDTPQTSCDPSNLNGQIDAAVDVGGVPTTAGYTFRWFTGTDTTSVLNPANIDPVDPFSAINLAGNGFYTSKVTDNVTRCENTGSIFLKEIISVPRIVLTQTPIVDCQTPGFITATIFADLDGDGTEEPVPLADYGDYRFTWHNGNTTAAPVLANTTTNVLEFLDDLVTPIPSAYYTVTVENVLTTCASTDVTELLSGPGPLFDIDIQINSPLPASCAQATGVMTAYINDGMGGTVTGYTFEWYNGTITNGIQNPPPSFYTSPPVQFNVPALDVDASGLYGSPPYNAPPPAVPGYQPPDVIPGPSFTGPTLYGIASGTYTVVATRDSDGCKEYLTTFLPYLDEPVIILAEIKPDDCSGDIGEISVDITVPPARVPSDYKIWLIAGSNPTLNPPNDPSPFQSVISPAAATGNNFTGLGPGVYTVVAQENPALIATGCFSSPVMTEMREALPPVLDLLGAGFNTTCGIATGDGSLQITFRTDPSDPFNPAFPPPPPPVVYNPAPQTYTVDVFDSGGNNVFSNGGYASATNLTIPNLLNDDFDVTVTSSQGCSITKTFTVPWNPQVSEIGSDFVKADALYCDPALEVNARIEVQSIAKIGGGAENLGDYRFDWFTNINLTANVLTAVGDPTPAKGGEILSNVGAPLPSAPTTIGSYWVTATKVTDGTATGGVGCFTAPLKVDILDKTVNPTFAITPFSNTACDANFEGSLRVNVSNPGSVAAAAGYAYRWLQTPAASPIADTDPNDGDGSGADGDGDNPTGLSDGVYRLEIENNNSGCIATNQTTILKNTTPIIVASATTVDQIICDPGGSATVVDVTVGGVVDPVHANFDFTWFRNDPTNLPPIIDAVNDADVLDVVSYPAIDAGTYFVKARRVSGVPSGSGCESAPLRVDIRDLSRDPAFTLTPFSNTACDMNFEGSIQINVTDPGSVPATLGYAYTWLQTPAGAPADTDPNDGDGDGTDGDGDNPTGLSDGVYRLQIRNNDSGCLATGQTTIIKNTTPIIVAAATKVDQVICDPDGSITVTDVRVGGVTDANHNNFDFSWYQSDPNSAPIINGIAGEDVLDINNFATIGAGSYFVKVKRGPFAPGAGCESAPFRVDISDTSRDPVFNMTPFSNSSCDVLSAEGSIQINVSDPGSLAATLGYAYRWIQTPPASPIADTDPNDGDGDGTDGDGDNPVNLNDGVYRLEITNNNTGCRATGQTTITINTTPIIVAAATKLNQLLCDPDGSITVTDVQVGGVTDPNHNNFDFTWYQSDPNSAPIINEVTGEDVLDINNFVTIGAATYFVKVKRGPFAPGAGCESAPFRVDILDQSKDPVFTMTPFTNTSCDPTFFEGSIQINVTDPGSQPATLGYAYSWLQTPAASPIADTDPNDGDGDGTDGDGDNPLDLSDGVYRLQIENTRTGCLATAQTTITRTTVPIIITKATKIDQFICNPDGSIEVTEVIVGATTYTGSFTDFDFAWFRNDLGNQIIPPTNDENLLDVNNYPTIGAGAYFVKAIGSAAIPVGRGCESAPLRVDIQDRHVNPIPQLQPYANSTCTLAFLNGAIVLQVTETQGPGAGGPFSYTYTYNDGTNPPVVTGPLLGNNGNRINDGDLDSLMNQRDGLYDFIIRNQITNCVTPAQVTISYDPVASKPNVLDVDTNFPFDCLGNGGDATVTAIRIGNGSPITGSPALDPPNFSYDWYDNATDAFANPTVPGNVPNAAPTNQRMVNMLRAGTYYVSVRDLLTDCRSTPTEVLIDSAQITYPVVTVTQTSLQLSCDVTIGTASLRARADGQDDSNPDYFFTWYNNLTATNPAYSDPLVSTDSIGDLLAGDYSVRVVRASTGCATERLFIVPPLDPKFLPKMAISGEFQTSCIVDNGSVVVRVLPFPIAANGLSYPFPYDFKVDLYNGNQLNANINQEPPAIPPDFPDMPPLPFSPPPGSFISEPHGIGIYTVRLLDNNTGCILVDTTRIADDRRNPIPQVVVDNPLTNCDTRFNGQLSASADGQPSRFYDFYWWSQSNANDTLSRIDKLIGQDQGTYFVNIVNKASGCDTLASGVIPTDQILPPAPSIVLVQPQTICWEDFYPQEPLARPNGWLQAHVNNVTAGYRFEWFTGELTNQQVIGQTPDTVGINNLHLISQFYTVNAVILATGCSNVTSLLLPDQRILPLGRVDTTPSYCEDARQPSGTAILQQLNTENVPLRQITWFNDRTNAFVDDGLQLFNIPPGFYRAEFLSNEFCYGEAVGEVKTEILAYNLVSSNNDGANDSWIIDCISNFTKAAGAPEDNNVKVFNRNGVLVYEANGYNNADVVFRGIGENGLYSLGNTLPDGTYFFVIDKRDGSKPITGFFELVR